MSKLQIPSSHAYLYSLISFFIAALSLSGVILKTDLTGRIIWCCIWGIVGLFWLFGIVKSTKTP